MRRLALLDDSVIMPSRSGSQPKIVADPKMDSLSPPKREKRGDSRRLSPEQPKHREDHPMSRSFRNDSD